MYNNISMVEMVTVLCGGNLYQTSIIHGIFDNKPKESEVGSLIRRMLGSDKSITGGGFQIIDNTMPILISAKNYYYDNINVLKYDHNAKLDIDRLINIIETAGLVV